jgi:hypothetical protein
MTESKIYYEPLRYIAIFFTLNGKINVQEAVLETKEGSYRGKDTIDAESTIAMLVNRIYDMAYVCNCAPEIQFIKTSDKYYAKIFQQLFSKEQ